LSENRAASLRRDTRRVHSSRAALETIVISTPAKPVGVSFPSPTPDRRGGCGRVSGGLSAGAWTVRGSASMRAVWLIGVREGGV
jgi:hypothetical protein